jgi:hypothetical protein
VRAIPATMKQQIDLVGADDVDTPRLRPKTASRYDSLVGSVIRTGLSVK